MDEIERGTYKFEMELPIKMTHPMEASMNIEPKGRIFKCKYQGVTLDGEPHGFGIVSLSNKEDEEEEHQSDSEEEVDSVYHFVLYANFYKGYIQGGPALINY